MFFIIYMPTSFMPLGGSKGRSGLPYPQAAPVMSMYMIKSNDWYYKTGSQPSCPVGGSCNRGTLNAIRRRT